MKECRRRKTSEKFKVIETQTHSGFKRLDDYVKAFAEKCQIDQKIVRLEKKREPHRVRRHTTRNYLIDFPAKLVLSFAINFQSSNRV